MLVMAALSFSIVTFRDGQWYSSWSPELDVASQGHSIKEAIANLKEAIELHLECISKDELKEVRARMGTRLVTKTIEVPAPA